MGYITIRDGISSRRIEIPELSETVSIDLNDGGEPVVTVSADVTVERLGSEDVGREPGLGEIIQSASAWDWGTRAQPDGRTN